MEKDEIINKLNGLTLDTDMLLEVLHNALKNQYMDGKDDTISACCLLGIIREKFREIRGLF